MTTAANIREFLISRRSRLTPADAGLPDFGGRRRVPGLRREEVALLAGMSVEYYVRLERGNASGISDAILDGISRALKLDDAEHAHLYDLVRAANRGTRTPQRKPASRTHQIRPGTRQILDAMTFPAIIQNGRMDVVATNALGRALFSEMFVEPHEPVNFARFLFLDPRAGLPTANGTTRPSKLSLCSAPNQGACPPIEPSAASSTSSQTAAANSWPSGKPTTCGYTWPARNSSTTRRWATSISVYEAMQLMTDPGLQFVGFTAEPGPPLTTLSACSEVSRHATPRKSGSKGRRSAR